MMFFVVAETRLRSSDGGYGFGFLQEVVWLIAVFGFASQDTLQRHRAT